MEETPKTYDELAKENEELRKALKRALEERNYYEEMSRSTKFSKRDVEDKVEKFKDAAKTSIHTGLHISKDLFKTGKAVFSVAKDSFKEEWEKNKEKSQTNQSKEKWTAAPFSSKKADMIHTSDSASIIREEDIPFSFIREANEQVIDAFRALNADYAAIALKHLGEPIRSTIFDGLEPDVQSYINTLFEREDWHIHPTDLHRAQILFKQALEK